MGTNLIYLASVGVFIDQKTLITYKDFGDKTPDLDTGMPLSKVHNNWIKALSTQDYETIINL